ncbi:MAG: FAD/NAD(P)-binding oxidoreductase [Nitrospirota bacterium]
MAGKTICILGGGSGGLVVANMLKKELGSEHRVVLIDKESYHLFNPSLLWLMVGWRRPEQMKRDLGLLRKKGIDFTQEEVAGIDFNKQVVKTTTQDINYDYLVISLGADIYPERVAGFKEGAYNLYQLSDVIRLRDDLSNFKGDKAVVMVSSIPFKCPAAPYEAALLLNAYFKRQNKNVQVQVVSPESQPMPVAGPVVGSHVVSMLEASGIKYMPNTTVKAIKADKKELEAADGKNIPYDMLIGVPAHGAPNVIKNSSVAGETGWIPVNARTLETKIENVYAIGDVTSIPLPAGKPLPKAGVFAHLEAEVVAHNIAAKIKGAPASSEFDGRGYCFVELGDGRAGFAKGNFYAEPAPAVSLYRPGRHWHIGKVLFEKWWLWKWF